MKINASDKPQNHGLNSQSRPSFEQIYMNLALELSQRSTCTRKSVGCVITSSDYRRVLAVGYNGNASGLYNGCDNPEIKSGCGCLHAEMNSVINCDSPRLNPKIVFITWSPCSMCAKALINLGNVEKVYYHEAYSNTSGLDLLSLAGIETAQT